MWGVGVMQSEKYSWRKFFAFIRVMNPNKRLISLGISLSIISSGLALYIPILLKNLVDNASLKNVEEFGVLFFIVTILQIVFSFLSGISLMTAGESLVRTIRNKIIRRVFDAPYTFFEKVGVEKLSSHIINDSALLSNTVTSDLNSLVSSIITITGAIVILFMLDSSMMIVALIVLPLGLLLLMPLMSVVSSVSNRMQINIARFNDSLISQFRTMSLIKSYGTKRIEEDKSFENTDKLFKLGIKEGKIQIIISPIISAICLFMIVAILLMGIRKINNGSLSIGTFAAFMLYTFQLISPVTTVGHVFSSASIAKGASSRISELFYKINPQENGATKSVPDPQANEVSLKNVCYSGVNDVQVLNNVSLRARKNKITAIIGPSGSGKTAIVKILSRLYTPTSGKLLLGKIDSQKIDSKSWAALVGTVFQDNMLVEGSIKDNLLYGSSNKKISDSRLWSVLRNCLRFSKASQ